ncbi:hypothetical protein AVEN_71687-1 [Araneus ventricosus]|uniref:Uncharacterized protein n=1 Tax=Araneus ventricosus TaxID=182803 RepID=A0A4Y2FAM4_ARAVE|nr:hypothetical protein AVEN_71687-1 [Araneus ventricosus]
MMTSETATPLQAYAPHQREDISTSTYALACSRPQKDESSMESGFEPGTGTEVETLPPGHRSFMLVMGYLCPKMVCLTLEASLLPN